MQLEHMSLVVLQQLPQHTAEQCSVTLQVPPHPSDSARQVLAGQLLVQQAPL